MRRVRLDGIIETIAGNGEYGDTGDGRPAILASFRSIRSLAVDVDGALYICDGFANRVRKVNSRGVIQGFAGTGLFASGGEGEVATESSLYSPRALALDADGSLIIFTDDFRLRKVTPSGVISTLARTLPLGIPSDVAAGNSCFIRNADAMSFDQDGNLFLPGSGVICVLDRRGRSWLVAGSPPPGFAGDGGPATAARLRGASGLTVDSSGKIYFSDSGNHIIRALTRVSPLLVRRPPRARGFTR